MAASALASGTGTSAGDQQYVDPLTSTTSTRTTTHASTTPAASSSTTPAPSSPAVSTGSTTSAPATTTPASSSTSHASSGTLPFTGLNIEACLAVGVGLLAAGLALRRAVAAA